jgi:anti-sigma B factor antagonist
MTSLDHPGRCPAPLRVALENVGGVRVVRIGGELDSFTAPLLREVLRGELVRRPPILAVDLSELEFLGVAGLDVLLTMWRVAQHGGTTLALTGTVWPRVARLLDLVGWSPRRYRVHMRSDVAPRCRLYGWPSPIRTAPAPARRPGR